MTGFMDLPKAIRERIYSLHLTHDKPIREKERRSLVCTGSNRSMPPLLTLSPRIEREAAPYYYAHNTFEFLEPYGITRMSTATWPRHLRLIRRVTIVWEDLDTDCGRGFQALARYRSLQELRIYVDEREMIGRLMRRRQSDRGKILFDEPSPQQQLAVLHFPGVTALLKLSDISLVQFAGCLDGRGTGHSMRGPIPGGVLETQVAPRLMSPKTDDPQSRVSHSTFPFLSLSPELRNRTYDMSFCMPGQLQLASRPTFAHARKRRDGSVQKAADSVLSLLAVNRQIHDEAVGLFYHRNTFVFEHSMRLHAFMQSAGPRRHAFVCNLILHYDSFKRAGVDIADLTFPLLRQLSGLQNLEVIMHGELGHKIVKAFRWQPRCSIDGANPGLIPGIKYLSDLRGIRDIKLRCSILEAKHEDALNHTAFPDFSADSEHACAIKLAAALDHFNAALRKAQEGKVSQELLQDNKWHTRDIFPALV